MIVITGPSGNVGITLTQLMLRHHPSVPVRVAAYDVAEITRLCGPSECYVRLDYDDRVTWPAVLQGVKTLFLLFPLPTTKEAGTRMNPFIDAAVAAGCQHVLFVSVSGAAKSKGVPHYPVEQHLKSLSIGYTFLRPCYYMQNVCRNITTHDYDIAMYNEVFVPAGAGATALVDARDVAEVAEKVLLNPAPHVGKAYSLTGSEQMDFTEIAAVMSRVTGRQIRYTNPSLPRFVFRMRRRGIPWDIVMFMCFFYSMIRFGKPDALTDELKTLIGRAPRKFLQFAEEYGAVWNPEAHRQLPVIPDWAGGTGHG